MNIWGLVSYGQLWRTASTDNTFRKGEGVFDISVFPLGNESGMKIGSMLKSPWVCRYEWYITDFSNFLINIKRRVNFRMKFRVQNLFLEDIHLILFLPKISCASTKLSTQLSETVEKPFSSDITRTHRYKSAILNNVARSSALGTTLRDVCGSFALVCGDLSEHVNRKCFCDTTLPEFGQERKASRYKAFTKYTYTF